MSLKISDWVLEPYQAVGFQRSELRDHLESQGYVHHTEYLHLKVSKRYGLLNITSPVAQVIERSQVKDGFCFVSTMHITAGIYINDAESGLLQDIARWIEKLAPYGEKYVHHETGEDNADAHLKSYLTNHALTAPVSRGQLDFGTWQQIFYAEFDGMREKKVLVKVTGLK